MAAQTQTYENHARFSPAWHFFAFPVLAINVIVAIVALVNDPGTGTAWGIVVALALAAAVFLARLSSLANQDRLIRLEERLRLQRLLPDDQQTSIEQLSMRQLIALRFAPDEELPELAQRCVAGEFASPKAIKQAIRTWRPDLHRV